MGTKMKNKNKNNLKAGIITACLGMCIVCTVLGLASCRGMGNHVEVRISLQDPSVVDFKKYDKILYKDLTLESMPKDFDPGEELKVFFLDEFPKAIDRKIEHWEPGKAKDAHLLITGTLKLDIKERSKIKEVKDKAKPGKKKNVFVTAQHWTMTLTAELKDSTTGGHLLKEDFTAKLEDDEVGPTSSKFNFENLFYKITNRLVKKLTRTKKMQRRYLLL